MIEEFEPRSERKLPLEDAVKIALSRSGIGDTNNNFNGLRMSLEIPEFWEKLKPTKTYQEYIQQKYEERPDIAAAILESSDKTFVANYNAAVERINEAFGTGIISEEQAKKIQHLCDEARKIVVEFAQSL